METYFKGNRYQIEKSISNFLNLTNVRIKNLIFRKNKAMANPRKKTGKMTDSFRHAASSNSGRVHVVPSKDGWSVKKEGAVRASVVSSTKAGAVKAANNIKSAERIIVHKKDGTIQSNSKKK